MTEKQRAGGKQMSQRLAQRPEHHDLNSCFTAVGRKGAVAPGVRKSSGEKDSLETPLPAPQQNLLRKPPLEFFHTEALSIPPFT